MGTLTIRMKGAFVRATALLLLTSSTAAPAAQAPGQPE